MSLAVLIKVHVAGLAALESWRVRSQGVIADILLGLQFFDSLAPV